MSDDRQGPNRALIGASAAEFARHVATPALCIDRPAFMANLASMQAAATAAGKALRPHMKAHKTMHIAGLQRDAGAIGVACATAKEAEAAAAAGIASILLTTPVMSPMVLRRLAALGADMIMAVDTIETLDRLADAAGDRQLGVLIDLNVGQNRTGVSTGEAAVALARHLVQYPALRLRGVQAYYGHLQHVLSHDDRRQRVEQQFAVLHGMLEALEKDGHAIEIVSGGGTGTAEFDLGASPFTEIQPGSYLFMDSQYAAIERRQIALLPALTVLTRVTSNAVSGQVVVDAGTKALSTDPAQFRLAGGAAPEAKHRFMGDEHSAIDYASDALRPTPGSLLSIVATHCDPTVNLHERFHVMENGRLVDIWPLDARGY